LLRYGLSFRAIGGKVKRARRKDDEAEGVGDLMEEHALTAVIDIMMDFARSTGLSSSMAPPRRYLWTDAFGVCNFLGLYEKTGDESFKELALRLVEQVHQVLGRHRDDDQRKGWLSGLDDREAALHPTRGGLRIGKRLKERRPGEPFDERLEWDRDGQYFHYLTKWMHALNRVARVTGDYTYNRWAFELARTSCATFVYQSPRGGHRRMAWKMSIDLSHPLVPHMGQHDALDGLITYSQTAAIAADAPDGAEKDLSAEIRTMDEMCRGKGLATDDPLGLGSLLSDAYRLGQLIARESCPASADLLHALLSASRQGLEAFTAQNQLSEGADYRLPFREFGLSIGLHAAQRLRALAEENRLVSAGSHAFGQAIEAVLKHAPPMEAIEGFWLRPEHQKSETWTEHRDINMVMLATSLSPDGFLKVFGSK